MADENESGTKSTESTNDSKTEAPASIESNKTPASIKSNNSSSTVEQNNASNSGSDQPSKPDLVRDGDETQTVKDTPENSRSGLAEESSDVITIDDGRESDIVKRTVSDAEFFGAVSETEQEFYRTHRQEPDEVQLMKIQCTACWKQVSSYPSYLTNSTRYGTVRYGNKQLTTIFFTSS